MQDISKSVIKKDHFEKMSGRAVYVCDKELEDMYYGKVVRSTVAH